MGSIFLDGRIYHTRSDTDYDSIWKWEVVSRTAKFVTLREVGET